MRTSEKYIQTSYRKIKPPDAIDIDELVQNSNNNNNQILSAIPYAPKISKIDPYVMHNHSLKTISMLKNSLKTISMSNYKYVKKQCIISWKD